MAPEVKKEKMGMKKGKNPTKVTPLQRIIRILILVIFVVSLIIATGRLVEWNQKQKELEQTEKQKQEVQGQLGD